MNETYRAVGDPRVDEAARAADAAARACGVRVRPVTGLAELDDVCRLYDSIWRPGPHGSVMSVEMLRGFTKAGSYVAGAYDDTGLVGACVGMFGHPGERILHSHIAGVSPDTRRRGVGFALKLHQRAWALRQGLDTVSWTFDPLVSRNAFFNLAKLGACAHEYLTNFYGEMRDSINGGGDTDRLLIRWRLDTPAVVAACAGTPVHCDAAQKRARGAVVGLDRSAGGAPVAGRLDGPTVLVAVPPDVESLRSTDPGCAKEWRLAVREALGGLLAEGATITGFDRAGWYVVTTGQAGG